MQIMSSAEVTRHKTWDLSWAENPMWIGANWWGILPHRSRYLYTIHMWLYYLGSAILSMRCICHWSIFCLLMMMQYDVITTQGLAIFQHGSGMGVMWGRSGCLDVGTDEWWPGECDQVGGLRLLRFRCGVGCWCINWCTHHYCQAD
jgi:hypothetical protein